jgi:RNA polymerase sigma-70 factor (ECF subfamily)
MGAKEDERKRLTGIAFRMLGSLAEAEDAVQEAWIKIHNAAATSVENPGAWATTVVAHVCLDALRARRARREEPDERDDVENQGDESGASARLESYRAPSNPEEEAALAESVGQALLVVLDTLAPKERIAFVLHDMFGLPFEEIAPMVDKSAEAARQLASRARRRVQGAPRVPEVEIAKQREVVAAFLVALRAGDFDGLVAVLDPDVVVKGDAGVGPKGAKLDIRGAKEWARGAVQFARLGNVVKIALVDGVVGAILAPRGRLSRALKLTVRDGRIVEAEVVADPVRLAALEIAVVAEA